MLKYSQFLKNIYGEKVYKIPVNTGGTCPNRDGTKGVGGCIFCSEIGAGFELLPETTDFLQQIHTNIAYIGKKYKANCYLIYFQNFTGTYLPIEQFASYLEKVCTVDKVAGVCVSTRPDCLSGGHLDLLAEFRKKGYDVFIELGLQSANDATLCKINRGHTVSDYIQGAKLVKDYGFYLDTHLILNLPWDTESDVLEAARLMNRVKTDSVKLHSLHIPYGTRLYEMYQNKEFEIISKEEYFHRLYLFLKELNPNIALQRLFSRAPKEDTAFCNWQTGWWKLEEEFFCYAKQMEENAKKILLH
ncbi:MAG: TIGR01212 family radical SAM protein [Clostridia bacterium]|nr:TIGR01212 family radical SAM protein [Clostridia bacterium]